MAHNFPRGDGLLCGTDPEPEPEQTLSQSVSQSPLPLNGTISATETGGADRGAPGTGLHGIQEVRILQVRLSCTDIPPAQLPLGEVSVRRQTRQRRRRRTAQGSGAAWPGCLRWKRRRKREKKRKKRKEKRREEKRARRRLAQRGKWEYCSTCFWTVAEA